MADVPTQHTDFCSPQPRLFSKFSEKVTSEESKIFLANRKLSALFTLLVLVQCNSLPDIITPLGLSHCRCVLLCVDLKNYSNPEACLNCDFRGQNKTVVQNSPFSYCLFSILE